MQYFFAADNNETFYELSNYLTGEYIKKIYKFDNKSQLIEEIIYNSPNTIKEKYLYFYN